MALPPEGKRFNDPMCELVFQAFLALSPAAQVEFARKISELVITGSTAMTDTQRMQLATARALRLVADYLKKETVTVKEYRRFRHKHPELDLPPDGTMRMACGGHWNGCLRVARLNPVVDGDVQVRGRGTAFEVVELLSAMTRCRKDTKVELPSESIYLGWRSRPEIDGSGERIPRSCQTFRRVFGSVRDAARASILWEQTGEVPEGAVPLSDRGQRVTVKPQRRRYSDDELCAWLVAARDDIGHTPARFEYTRFRRKVAADAAKQGLLIAVPDEESVSGRFGGWENALRAAGLPLDEWAVRRGRMDLDDAVMACVLDSYEATSGELNDRLYCQWRRDVRAADQDRVLPSPWAVQARLGGWREIRAWADDVLSGRIERKIPR